jgi:drug/metabolite transporter (DMT)-like permease
MIWGTSWYAIKFQLGVVPADVSIFYRFFLAGSIIMIICRLKHLNLKFNRYDHGFFLIQGFFLFSLNYVLFYQSTFVLTTGLIAVIFTSMLIFNTLNSAIIFRTSISQWFVVAAFLGITGISLIFLPEFQKLNFDKVTIYAVALAFAGSFSASLGNMVSIRNQRHSIPVLQANAWGMLYGSMLTCLYALGRGSAFTIDFSPDYIISLLYLSLLGTVVAFWSYLTLLGRIGAGNAAYVTVIFPIVALIISTFFENYQWSLMALAGVIISFAGNLLVLKARRMNT